jgi:hypothetical protein
MGSGRPMHPTPRLKHGEPIFRSQSHKAVSRKQWYLDFFLSICPVIEPLNGRQQVLNISLLQLTDKV